MTEHYEPEMADPGDGDMFGALEDAALRNPGHGPACGVDACLECWLESRATASLAFPKVKP